MRALSRALWPHSLGTRTAVSPLDGAPPCRPRRAPRQPASEAEARSPPGAQAPPPPPGRRPGRGRRSDQRRPWAAGRGSRSRRRALSDARLRTFPRTAGQDSALPLPRACVQPRTRRASLSALRYWPRSPSACSRLRVLSHRLPGTRPGHTLHGVRCPEGSPALPHQALRVWLPDPTDLAFPAPRPATPCPSPSCSLPPELAVTGWHYLSEASRCHRARSVCTQCAPGSPWGSLWGPSRQRLPPTPLGAQAHQAESPGQWPGPMAHMVPRSVGLAGMWPSPAILGFVFVEIVPGLAAGEHVTPHHCPCFVSP